MISLLLVALGGAGGSVLRHLAGVALKPLVESTRFPASTFVVNAIGGFLIGLVTAMLARQPAASADPARALLVTGFLGGFTTFSAFSLETLRLIQEERPMAAFGYAALSVLVGLGGCALGVRLGR
jgi:CrcB protein